MLLKLFYTDVVYDNADCVSGIYFVRSQIVVADSSTQAGNMGAKAFSLETDLCQWFCNREKKSKTQISSSFLNKKSTEIQPMRICYGPAAPEPGGFVRSAADVEGVGICVPLFDAAAAWPPPPRFCGSAGRSSRR